jgi:hypothetical protein
LEQKAVSPASTVVAVQDQVSSVVDGEAVILGLTSGVYYGLDPVGTRIWELIKEPASVAQVRDALLAEYEVEPERCEADLLELLQRLLDEGMIEVVDG